MITHRGQNAINNIIPIEYPENSPPKKLTSDNLPLSASENIT
jgi:hypothetical protein